MTSMQQLSARISLALLLLLGGVAAAPQTGTPNGSALTAYNSVTMTGNGTVTSSSFVTFTTNTLVLPIVPPSTTRRGFCDIVWQTSALIDTPTFALNTNATSTGLWILGSQTYPTTATITNLLPIAAVSTATQTAFTAALTAGVINTSYQTHVTFTLQTNTNPQQITVYAKINGGTLTVEAGSGCSWMP